jgi:hypothetical protein
MEWHDSRKKMASISTQTATPKKFVLKQDASKLTDQELIDEFTKRFIVPQFYSKEHIVERIEENGFIPDEDNVEKVIKNFNKCGQALDESLEDMIEDVFLREEEDHDICGQTGGKCGDFVGCGKKVLCEDTNMFGNTSFCIPCYEKYEEDFKKLEEEEEEPEDKNKDDYTEDVEEDPIQEATIDYSTYKEYFAEYYQEEKEHDDETFFRLELYNKKDPEPYEMSAWSDMYFKIEPDHEKTNKSFERVKNIHYNTSSSFAMMLCGIDFEDVE